ncbi:MAG: hypothetical protein Q8P02_04350, partial [Candidatus Micrarchaeota archaeon]|nr:hypothetical protein [Candidatus Micrarchaeota archaeon]
QLQKALQNHLRHSRFPVKQFQERRRLDEKKGNDFQAIILALALGQKTDRWLPRMEVQITTRRKDAANQLPQNARRPRWMFFKGVVPKTDLRQRLGIAS